MRSSRLILSVVTSRSASIVRDCGAELFTRIGGEEQVLFQISSEHCPGVCALLQCWKIHIHAATELEQHASDCEKTLEVLFVSQVHMISGSRRSSNLPSLPLGKTQNTRTQKTLRVAQTIMCARVTTQQTTQLKKSPGTLCLTSLPHCCSLASQLQHI